MKTDQRKAVLAMHVAGATPEAIAIALDLFIEDVRHALKIKPNEAAPAPKPAPAPSAPSDAHPPEGVKLYGNTCAIVAPSRFPHLGHLTRNWRPRVIR